MAYYMARSLGTLLQQVNTKFPNRSKASDGWIGDTSHSARKSDHNPDASGCVCALDITHDPASGMDSYLLAEALRTSADHRISYIISNGRISNPRIDRGGWRTYHGADKHNHHVHISVIREHADETSPWNLSYMEGKKVSAYVRPPETLRRGDHGNRVTGLQRQLGLTADGLFGLKTQTAVKAFQTAHGLVADGVVGPSTWAELEKEKRK